MWSEGIGRAEEEIPRQEETLEPRQGPSARGDASRLLDWYEETRRGTKPTIVKHPATLARSIDQRLMANHMLKPKKSPSSKAIDQQISLVLSWAIRRRRN